MDIVTEAKIHVPNSVIASGLTHTDLDEELEKHLIAHGSIKQIAYIDDPKSEFHQHMIVEFAYSSAMDTLRPLLPTEYTSSVDRDVTFQVRALDTVYTQAASSATKGYLEELQSIAAKSGKSFQEVLQEELKKISMGKGVNLPTQEKPTPAANTKPESHKSPDCSESAGASQDAEVRTAPQVPQTSLLLRPVSPELVQSLPMVHLPSPSLKRAPFQSRGMQAVSMPAGTQRFSATARSPHVMLLQPNLLTSPSRSTASNIHYQAPLDSGMSHPLNMASGNSDTAAVNHPSLTMDDVNPPVVQRVVVEHVMRANETMSSSMHSSFRLRSFSGRTPRPNNELDYDTWRANVDLLLADPSMSDLHRTRKILDSLLPPATDVIQHVNPQAPPSEYLQLLDSVYGSVEDGDELLAKFMGTLQNNDEKPSHYLNRLQVILSAVIRRGGIPESERSRYLLKQFCRGCWDNGLIADLQLEQRTNRPPCFADLVVLIRTEEDKQAAKENRMRKHLGLHKQSSSAAKVRTVSHRITACTCAAPEEETTETGWLKKQMDEIQAQVAVMQTTTPHKTKSNSSGAAEIKALKQQLDDIQGQVTNMKTAAHETKNDSPEAAEIKTLKHQLAKLQAQVTTSQAQSQQTVTPARSRDISLNVGHQQNSRRRGGQPSVGEQVANRPRPWYCFCCGEDGHLAGNCEDEPNPSLVEEKRRLLREKQQQWDHQNGGSSTQRLNY